MSSALAICGVTRVLQYLLNNVLNPIDKLNVVKVSALAPDIVQRNFKDGESLLQVNLFLHQVSPNAAWRNEGLPARAAAGSSRLSNPPLALNLQYLLTAYASEDCLAEVLVGHAVQFLHENPVLMRDQIRSGLGWEHAPDYLNDILPSSGLAEQIETIKITPATLGREEMAWLWTALKADYRPTLPFEASVVLIQRPAPLVLPLPVLRREVRVQPGLHAPSLASAVAPHDQPVACSGESITVHGFNLDGVSGVRLVNSRLQINETIAVANPGPTSIHRAVSAARSTGPRGRSVSLVGSGTIRRRYPEYQ
jgi:hypothetical protein